MKAGTVHNAIGALAALYTELVGELLTENDQLKAVVQKVGEQLKTKAAKPKGSIGEVLLAALHEAADSVEVDRLTDTFTVVRGERRYTVSFKEVTDGE